MSFITSKIDSFLESISGPSIEKRVKQLEQESNDLKYSHHDGAGDDSKIRDVVSVQDNVSNDLSSEDEKDVVNEEEYTNSTYLFKIPFIKTFIRATYNPGDKSIPDYERFFTFKLDLYVMSWVSIAYCIKSIDQSNISNAYVTGMKEDLNLVGKQYNWIQTYFTIGYAIMIIPSQIIITHVKANRWLPATEFLWGIVTAVCGAKIITTARQMYPLRFFIGFLEASSWPGIIVMLMSWYTPYELASRAAGFGAAGIAGSIFTGFMQAAITKTLNNRYGLEGWRWLFIINGIMTVLIALFGFVCLPSTPEEGDALWLTSDDKKIAMRRTVRFGKKTVAKFKLSDVPRTLKNYRVYAYILSYMPWTWANFGLNYFNIWLKTLKHPDGTKALSSYQVNLIPSGGYGISFVTMIIWAKLADLYIHRRFFILIINGLIGVLGTGILAAWPSSTAFKYVGFFIVYQMNATGPILNSVLADIFADDPVLRSITIGIAVTIIYAMDAWYPLIIWPVSDAPHYKYGWNVSVAFSTFSLLAIGVFFFVHKRSVIQLAEKRHYAKINA